MEEMKSSVIGGHDAKEGAWPWMAYLRIETHKHISSCGGTIINSGWILTAAHCVEDSDLILAKSYVRLGAYQLDTLSPNEATYTFSKVIIHRDYDVRNTHDDVALVNLDKKIKFSIYIQPVILAQSSDSFDPRSNCFAIGWGSTGCNTDLKYPRTLQELNIPLGKCDLDKFICAGESGKLVYEGDSGGPLMCYIRKTWIQAGIANFVKDCNAKVFPAYFASVPKYLTFINQHTLPSIAEI